ncbi:uncharacterized protein L203_105114 [Cryptococcus depauperatus CBS 7841]|uniref:Ysc84 actin-binding domain-containing protein n=1 Tax=Cryptococcus depauperatus CBS 7841 TaxID=1295531 RepID=A0AAJ8JX04_9TREE
MKTHLRIESRQLASALFSAGPLHNVQRYFNKKAWAETFSPVTSDSLNRMDKCARILRAFIGKVDGVVTEGKMEGSDGRKKKKKVIRKIPPAVIDRAKGLVVTKLSDGSWSAPTSISPNILSAVPLLGADVYDCALVIRDQKALESFETRKITIGAELGVAARQYGGGAAVEAGLDKAPVFIERFEENDAMYHWPRAEASDILSGKDAESGKAQSEKGDTLDIIVPEGATEFERHNEEVLKLPSTPDMINGREQGSDLETKVSNHLKRPASLHGGAVETNGEPTGEGEKREWEQLCLNKQKMVRRLYYLDKRLRLRQKLSWHRS